MNQISCRNLIQDKYEFDKPKALSLRNIANPIFMPLLLNLKTVYQQLNWDILKPS
jgi:hypothetical protein